MRSNLDGSKAKPSCRPARVRSTAATRPMVRGYQPSILNAARLLDAKGARKMGTRSRVSREALTPQEAEKAAHRSDIEVFVRWLAGADRSGARSRGDARPCDLTTRGIPRAGTPVIRPIRRDSLRRSSPDRSAPASHRTNTSMSLRWAAFRLLGRQGSREHTRASLPIFRAFCVQ